MAELNIAVYDFRNGVLTLKLKDRPNLDLYKSGVLVGQNFLTQIHGPTEFRAGFVYSRTTRRNNVPFFIPFTFADDEAYILSFTDRYMRIFTDSGPDTVPGVLTEATYSISGITQANPGVVTVVGHPYADGDEVYIDNAVDMTELNGQFFLVKNATASGVSERNWTFSNPANYTYVPASVTVTGGVAKLVGAPYPVTNPTIETNSGFPFTAVLTSFTETATKPVNTEIQYIISIDNGVMYLYWSGAAWVASAGTYAQSNTAAIVNTNIAALGTSGTLKFKAFLHTTDITATPELNNVHTQFTVAVSNTFTLTDQDGNDIDTSGYEPYIGTGTVARVYEIESPYLEADLPQLKFAQKADIMYIDHPSYAPRKLTRYGDGTWTLRTYTRTNDPFGQATITNISQNNPGQVTTSAAHGFLDDDEVLIEEV
jgi:hypothetical protein